MLSSLAPARRRLVLAVLLLVVAAAVAAAVVAITAGGDDAPPVDQGTLGPVVLVPGYGGSTSGLNRLADVLRRNGRDATVADLPGNGTGDLDAQARSLGDTIDRLRQRTGNQPVDVVGYSAGGVVARLWAREHGGAAQARRIVTLGSPHHGTDLAALAGSALPGACPTACQQLAASSGLLGGLNAGDETPSGPTWVSIWTTRDNVVVPPDSASLTGALDVTVQSVCPGETVQHSGLPTDPKVQAIVLAVLGRGAPARPASCATVSS